MPCEVPALCVQRGTQRGQPLRHQAAMAGVQAGISACGPYIIYSSSNFCHLGLTPAKLLVAVVTAGCRAACQAVRHVPAVVGSLSQIGSGAAAEAAVHSTAHRTVAASHCRLPPRAAASACSPGVGQTIAFYWHCLFVTYKVQGVHGSFLPRRPVQCRTAESHSRAQQQQGKVIIPLFDSTGQVRVGAGAAWSCRQGRVR
jgi:hypothetical protein